MINNLSKRKYSFWFKKKEKLKKATAELFVFQTVLILISMGLTTPKQVYD